MLRQNFLRFAARHENSWFFDKNLKEFAEKEEFNDEDRQQLFEKLRDYLVKNVWRSEIIEYFPQFFPIILSMAVPIEPSKSCQNLETTHSHKTNCVLLSKLLSMHPDVLGHTIRYFEKHPSPFEPIPVTDPAEKRPKMDFPPKNKEPSDEQLVIATLNILRSAPSHFKHTWDWSKFYSYLNHELSSVRFIAIKCMGIVLNMSEERTMSFIKSSIPASDLDDWITKKYLEDNCISPMIADYDVKEFDDCTKNCDSLVSIAGVLLPILNNDNSSKSLNLIPVPSMELNLRSLALAVASRKAVCLQGPVGCGKTAIVEYLAQVTGRGTKDMIKVQLGDQTDSKMLLGTYRCTDIPGEFVWQPGVLTQAALSGKWLLLEDIDSAALDVASVLSNLMETGTLSVPGYRDTIHAKSGFQLFFTQRLISTMSGLFRQSPGASSLLEKHWLCVHMDPLSKNELITIVQTLFPILSTIAMRIVDVFLLFSSGNHEIGINENLSSKTGRLISTRDLMKWCTRAIIDFDVSSPDSALKVMQDAIDIFCCSVPIQELRLDLAISVANTLGIIKTKAEYFINTHKPSVSINSKTFAVGRAKVSRKNTRSVQLNVNNINYSFTRPSASLLERITCCVAQKEPVLLVGETGTGKTSSIQFLARSIGQKLIVINMNQQSESADLIGGYKPVDIKLIITPIREEFEILFRSYYAIEPNRKFLEHVARCYKEAKWKTLVTLMAHSTTAAVKRLNSENQQESSPSERGKRPRKSSKERQSSVKNKELLMKWETLLVKLEKLKAQVKTEFSLAFAFIEGSLIKALQQGHWVLLDEINLASSETLECLSGLLEGSTGSISLLERGDDECVKRHQDFTMFACMNPATDVGKKELPVGLRNRFTEFYVDELTEPIDLQLLVNSYLSNLNIPSNKVEAIVKFYLNVRKEATNSLSDGTGHKPHFSLRTLCRALSVAGQNPCGNVLRSLYEAFCLSFLTQLDQSSYPIVQKLIAQVILDKNTMKATLGTPIPKPQCGTDEDYINFEGYWVIKGSLEPLIPDNYILTSSVRRNLKDLVRVVSIGKMPVLLQGDTSVGKTSLITYLAKASGHVCVRINNHEHTDLQEYIGSYVASETGKLVFKEGVLVEAMRKGYWIILDELNLAPSDVLEALNRVLDDNRELFIPETQDTVKAHSNFMLFATQNPPGVYGGRKVLSRAFRNRFVELHFDEIPSSELQIILHERCHMPDSYCKQIINVMTDLQMRRKSTAAFSGKQGFITLRDLFRWGERYRLAADVGEKLYDWSQHLADEGYLVLAAKVRKSEEAEEIRQVIKKHLKRDVDPSTLFTLSDKTSSVTKPILEAILNERIEGFEHIVWTYHMRRMAVLVTKSCQFNEPVLLIGETGGGKTTVCQLAAALRKKKLLSVNCHMHTESSDFLGNLRPVRDHSDVNNQKLFEWVDGPLITAMRTGDIFLADEISLADDSVLERMNSLLEPERSLLLAEKSTDSNVDSNELESVIIAHNDFCFIGTMNPGGDYGKKELSPALRNRFTEIWCEGCTNNDDLRVIIEHNLYPRGQIDNRVIAEAMIKFLDWLKLSEVGKRFSVSIRDVLTWVNFMNSCNNSLTKLNTSEAYLHGACLTYIDSLGSGVTGTESTEKLEIFRKSAMNFLEAQIEENFKDSDINLMSTELDVVTDEIYGVSPFYIPAGPNGKSDDVAFTFTAPTTTSNTSKLLRALQLKKPLLLEGSPGVGKTSLVSAIAKASGNTLLRINLSDQTDVADLFGADLPLEGGKGGQFAWKDGPFLRALRSGDWILLDELNLASQSVLEGLNACLDHRGEIYIPELGKTFSVKTGTKLFGCQNPLKQGGARRGLPKSFLNRFTQVYVDALSDDDLRIITQSHFPNLDVKLIENIIKFNSRLSSEAGIKWGYSGSPWEMNLRDITRLCELISSYEKETTVEKSMIAAVELIYAERMRTIQDKEQVRNIYRDVFGSDRTSVSEFIQPTMYITDDHLYLDNVALKRTNKSYYDDHHLLLLRKQMPVLKNLAYCVNMNWMPILVGASGTGKSSVVRVLAQLTGQRLRSIVVNSAMDTTEILGGFEQTDYNRHLEQLISDTEDLLITSITESIQGNGLQAFAELHRQLERVKVLTYDESLSRTMAAEIDLFSRRIEELLKLTTTMKSLESSRNTELTKIKDKLENLLALVKEDKCLNAGGKFEWIDSILVKCLQDGTWLLVDQVNLCSPAVLDRLNGLLEPGGVLTIGERGTDASGNVHTIKPNPNFRLFLTMDPRYGEISRAMRNRGVEIYLLGCDETSNTDGLDVKSQLNNLGLLRVNHQLALLDIHKKISDKNLASEQLCIIQLLHAAFLIAQQINRGFPTVSAFKIACTDVYIKSRYIQEPTMRKKLLSIIEETISSHQLTVDVKSYLNLPEITPNINDLLNNAGESLMKQQLAIGEAMNTAFYEYWHSNDSNGVKTDFLNEILDPEGLNSNFISDHVQDVYLHTLINFIEKASVNNLKERIEFIRDRSSVIGELDWLWHKLTELKELIIEKADALPSASLPWHPLASPCNFTQKQRDLALKLSLISYIKITNAEAVIAESLGRGKKEVSVEDFSRAVLDDRVPERECSVLVVLFTPVAEQISKWIETYIIDVCDNLSYNDFISLRCQLLCAKRFYEQGKEILYHMGKDEDDDEAKRINDIERTLRVHYQWMMKFIKRTIEESNNIDRLDAVESEEVKNIKEHLQTLLREVDVNLHSDDDGFRKLTKVIKKCMKILEPFKSEAIIDDYNKFEEIVNEFSPIRDVNTKSDIAWKLRLILLQLNESLELREKFINAWHSIAINQDEVEDEIISSAELYIDKYKLTLETPEKISQALENILAIKTDKELCDLSLTIQLWPIYEFLFMLLANKLHKDASDMMLSHETSSIPCHELPKFIGIPSIPIKLIALLNALSLDKFNESIVPELFCQLENFRDNSLAFKLPNVVLNFTGVNHEDTEKIEMKNINQNHLDDDPNSILQPNLIILLSNLILNSEFKYKENSTIKLANLANCSGKTNQLKIMNEILWKNSISFNSKSFGFYYNNAKLLFNYIMNYIESIDKAGTDDECSTIVCSPQLNLLPIIFKYKLQFSRPLNELRNFAEKLKTTPESMRGIDLGLSWIELGAHQIFLFTNLELIDPVEKVDLKIKYVEEDIKNLKNMIYAITLDAHVLGDYTIDKRDPRIVEARKALDNLYKKKDELIKSKGFRSNDSNYFELLEETEGFRETIGTPGELIEPASSLHQITSNEMNEPNRIVEEFVASANGAIEIMKLRERSLHQFYLRLEKNFLVNYRELVQPILTALAHILHGIKILMDEAKHLIVVRETSFDLSSTAQSFLFNLVRFPTIGNEQDNLLQLIDLCTCSSTREFIESQIRGRSPVDSFIEQFRILKYAIFELYNHTSLIGNLTPQLWDELNRLLQQIVLIWQKKEAEKQRELEDESSLYRNKGQIMGQSLTEEEEINIELRKLFPTHRADDFQGIDENQVTLEALPERKEVQDEETVSYKDLITEDDVRDIYEIHSKIVKQFIPAHWLQPIDDHPKRNYIDPWLERFKTFSTLLPQVQPALSSDLSKGLHMSFNILTSVAASTSQGVSFVPETLNTRPYDFYKSQNIEEVKQCLPILEAVLNRVNCLLKEWPEHPTLSWICIIIRRIHNFPITSPISRFLTGLELLLVKMKEWEENAHSGVSLGDYSASLTQQIIEWRKLELNCWKSCLESAFARLQDKTSRWWFLIYAVIESYLNKSTMNTDDADESGSKECVTAKQLIERLDVFMSQSTLVEFHARLELLLTFHSHVFHAKSGRERDELLSIFWNVYNYYNQFSNDVKNKINSLKTPIEKKLKDFVKIARWNDINYWSVKETVEKTHRTLYKLIREYENALKQNVGTCLLVKPSNYAPESNKGEWDRSRDRDYSIDPSDFITSLIMNEKILVQNNLIARSGKMLMKAKKLCKETILMSIYPGMRVELEQFIEDTMSRSIKLKNLEVDRTLPKPKQKSYAKSILQQKKMALADYFKTMSSFGISYRKGLLALKNRPDDIIDRTVAPLDISASLRRLDILEKTDEQMLAEWDGCQSYYYKSLIKLDALNSTLTRVQTDLGVSNMERCSGLPNHLMLLAHNQKKTLAENFDSFLILRRQLSNLMKIDSDNVALPLHDDIAKCANRLKDLLISLRINFEQLEIYMHSCPSNNDIEENLDIIILESGDIPIINAKKGDQVWSRALNYLKECANIVDQQFKNYEKIFAESPSSVLRTEVHYNFLGTSLKNIDKIKSLISKLLELFGSSHPITVSIDYLLNKIDRWSNDFRSLKLFSSAAIDYEDKNSIDFTENAESLIKTILLVIQNKYKEAFSCENDELPNADTVREKENEEPAEQEEISQLEDNGLREKLIEPLEKDIRMLKLNEVNIKLEELLKLSQKLNPSFSSQSNLILRTALPILNQYILFSQFYLNEQVALFRTTCKLLYLQLNVFLDLATNGFCIPKDLDLDAETDDDGIQQDTDKGGMGLADGDGKKDVSDRIESEDQLDDARPAGEEKEPQEDKDCKEEDNGIEMSENFDSKLQDLDKKEDDEVDDDRKDEDDEELDKEMGETEEGGDQLDKEIWGDDEEEEVDESNETEEQGKGEEAGDREMTAKDERTKDNSSNDDDNHRENREDGEEEKEEINEINEPDVNDDQINPYHGNHEPQPEPEPMDLPDDFNLDEDEGKENNTEGDENPFDIDEMKEHMPPPVEAELEKPEEEEKKVEEAEDSSDEEVDNGESSADPKVEDLDGNEEEKVEEGSNRGPDESETNEEEKPNDDQSGEKEAAPSTNDPSEETDAAEQSAAKTDGSHDKIPDKENQNDNQDTSATENNQEDGEDKGTGQAQSKEQESGHVGNTADQNTPIQCQQIEQRQLEKRKNPGESDENRALVDNVKPDNKKQKMIHSRDNSSQNEGNDEEVEEKEKDGDVDMCMHVKESEKYDNYATDAATQEQVKKQTIDTEENEDDEKDEDTLMDVDMHEDEAAEEDDVKAATQDAEKIQQLDKDKEKSKESSKGQNIEDSQMETKVDVDGENIDTMRVERAAESVFYTNLIDKNDTLMRIEDRRREIETMLSQWTSVPTTEEALAAWNCVCAVTENSARDLSEKLRLVLEPTQATRLKGDYRTGKRINMRKIIPYIASQFRKDKIWLRRTKPSKRDYQIVLALDDSSSMADNHSKELAFESLSLISKAMGYLEVGELSVISFGETPKVLHPLGEPFTEQSGSRLIQEMKFDQKKTMMGELVNFTVDMFENQKISNDNAKLLVVLSDGRGVFSEGIEKVNQAVRRAKFSDIFLVFIIVENPVNKDSILDIRMPIFENGKLLGIRPYMDSFPFPFYMILRDINALPGVLSDALRQWFEVVGKIDT